MGEDVKPRLPDISVNVWFEAYDVNDTYVREDDLDKFFSELDLFERLCPHMESLSLRRVSQRVDTYPEVHNAMTRTAGQLSSGS